MLPFKYPPTVILEDEPHCPPHVHNFTFYLFASLNNICHSDQTMRQENRDHIRDIPCSHPAARAQSKPSVNICGLNESASVSIPRAVLYSNTIKPSA